MLTNVEASSTLEVPWDFVKPSLISFVKCSIKNYHQNQSPLLEFYLLLIQVKLACD